MRWGLLNDARKLDKQQLTMTVQRFVALAGDHNAALPEIPEPRLQVDPSRIEQALQSLGLGHPQGKLLSLCPGAEYGPAKRWPEEYYAEVAREKIAQGWSVWLFGSEKDKDVAEKIVGLAGEGCISLAGRTSLEDAIDLMSISDAVVSNDSGLMHVAAALDIPLVAVYGSSDPGFTPPLNKKARILTLGLDCSPCFKRECPLGHLNCLREMKPEKVLEQLQGMVS
jgi:heptosyltransferase-2